ncbi:fructosamine kinase [Pseudonocardia cypriaca]|uniref:Fructosamine kinase n=1 Tax=Pseudonocardia cypriaca TaxID=882449 RepID=A0A543FUK8_9PSEU|nr:fructosamine kinase [Pseudonocardia cypriaca]
MTVLGVVVRGRVSLGGGAARVGLADGRTVVVKEGDRAAIAAEAAGLRWLDEAGGAPVPAVLESDGGRLVTELVPSGSPDARAADELGRALARTHAAGAPAFGAAPPGGPADARIGAAPMRNAPAPSWPEWYAADRLVPYLRTARDAGTLSADDARVIEAVADPLPALAGPAEPPARLHGDLWSGNVLWSPAGAVLIDPAAHGGHRETDLAMADAASHARARRGRTCRRSGAAPRGGGSQRRKEVTAPGRALLLSPGVIINKGNQYVQQASGILLLNVMPSIWNDRNLNISGDLSKHFLIHVRKQVGRPRYSQDGQRQSSGIDQGCSVVAIVSCEGAVELKTCTHGARLLKVSGIDRQVLKCDRFRIEGCAVKE